MDFQSRELYRHTVAHFAEHSDCTELEIAQLAIDLARDARNHPCGDPRLAWRKSHVGYYLIGEGAEELRRRAGVRLPFGERVQAFLRRHPDEFYLGGIELLTLLIVIAIMTPVFNAFNTFYGRILAIVVLLLPCSQSAVEVMNYLTTALAASAHSSQAGLLRRHSRRLRDHGRGAHAAAQREAGPSPGGRSGSTLSGQHQPQSALRVADRFARLRGDAQ